MDILHPIEKRKAFANGVYSDDTCSEIRRQRSSARSSIAPTASSLFGFYRFERLKELAGETNLSAESIQNRIRREWKKLGEDKKKALRKKLEESSGSFDTTNTHAHANRTMLQTSAVSNSILPCSHHRAHYESM